MIYDCFIFNNEFEVLDIRLNELSGVVDKFVLVESSVTHSAKPKRLYFEENKNKFKKFKKKIIHIKVIDTPQVTLPWIINEYQFNQMVRGLKNCKSTDTVLISDVDEIPRAEKIIEWNDGKNTLKVFEQTLSNFYLNNAEYANPPWQGTHMISFKHLQELNTTWIIKFTKPDIIIPDGGWHFSYVGDVKKIREKISNTTHQEFNNDKYNTPEKISKALLSGGDLFKLGRKFQRVEVDTLPKYVQDNEKKFKSFILETDRRNSKTTKIRLSYLGAKNIIRVKILRKIKQKL